MSETNHGLEFLNPNRVEGDPPPDALRTTELIINLLRGYKTDVGMSVLLNVVCLTICDVSTTSAVADNATKTFCGDLKRGVQKNYASVHQFKRSRR